MTPAEFEDRLHELLDARTDPLGDPECAAFLAEHPDRLEAFAHLVQRCSALPAIVPPRGLPRRRPWIVLAAAAAVAAAWILMDASTAGAAPPSIGRVLAADLRPIPSMLQPTATVRARTVLLAEPTAHLEVFSQWSTR